MAPTSLTTGANDMPVPVRTTSFSKKRPTPLSHSPSSSCSSSASTSSSSRRQRMHVSPSSPLERMQHDEVSSSSSSSGSSLASMEAVSNASTAATSSSVLAAAQQQQALLAQAQAKKQKEVALEREMKGLYELEYREEVLQYMYEMESATIASVELIDMQPELAWYMRPYLVDFLIEIHQQYRLRPETLYLALNIVDRYVSKRIVYKKHYQLVGCAALWIASKFEDAKDRVPTVEDLCAVCCSAYDQSAFIQMEGHVLSTINWQLGHPTAEAWLRAACAEGPSFPMEEQRVQHVARFIMEITLFHRAFVSIKPSDIANACLMLARYICGVEKPVHQRANPDRIETIKIAQMLDQHLAEHLQQVSATVVKKYSPSFYSRASVFVREWYLSDRRFQYVNYTATPSTRRTVGANTEVEMSSSSSPGSRANDSDSDSCSEDDDEESYPSTPITPTTSVSSISSMASCGSQSSSGQCGSDPFDDPRLALQKQQKQSALFYQQQRRTLPPVPQAQADSSMIKESHSSTGMQWQMQVIPPSQSQSTFSTFQ